MCLYTCELNTNDVVRYALHTNDVFSLWVRNKTKLFFILVSFSEGRTAYKEAKLARPRLGAGPVIGSLLDEALLHLYAAANRKLTVFVGEINFM